MNQPTLQLADRTYCMPRVVSSSVTLPKPRWTVILFLILVILAAVPFANYVRRVGEAGDMRQLYWLLGAFGCALVLLLFGFARLTGRGQTVPPEICLVPPPPGVFQVGVIVQQRDRVIARTPGWLTLGPNGLEFNGVRFDFRLGAGDFRMGSRFPSPELILKLPKPPVGPKFTIGLVPLGDDGLLDRKAHRSLRAKLEDVSPCPKPLYPPFWRQGQLEKYRAQHEKWLARQRP